MHTNALRKNRLDVISDNCNIKDNDWRTAVFEFSTNIRNKLPIADVAVLDIADKNEEFGIELGPVCFSHSH